MPWPTTSRHERGYGRAWEITRARILKRDKYLCQSCLPRAVVGAHVDHIKPKAKGGTDDDDNLQTLCEPCHKAKTITDAGKRPKQAFGADGWPID